MNGLELADKPAEGVAASPSTLFAPPWPSIRCCASSMLLLWTELNSDRARVSSSPAVAIGHFCRAPMSSGEKAVLFWDALTASRSRFSRTSSGSFVSAGRSPPIARRILIVSARVRVSMLKQRRKDDNSIRGRWVLMGVAVKEGQGKQLTRKSRLQLYPCPRMECSLVRICNPVLSLIPKNRIQSDS